MVFWQPNESQYREIPFSYKFYKPTSSTSSTGSCNLQARAIEVYKVSKGIARKIFGDIFSSNSRANYDLHYQSEFSIPLVKPIFNGAETISYLDPRLWDLVPLEIKQEKSLAAFKMAIKIWKPHNCPCGLWKKYIAGIGFIWIMIP